MRGCGRRFATLRELLGARNGKALPHLSRRAADGLETRRSQAGAWDPCADGDPSGVDQRWSLGSVSGSRAWGRWFRMLCDIDDVSRFARPGRSQTETSARRVALSKLSFVPCADTAPRRKT